MRRRIFPNLLSDVSELEQRQAVLERIMQAIGFSPENPFTLTVNDGTRNRVLIGKINGDYGIKIVDNSGNSVVLANGTIVANAIKTGTLDCNLITVANLNAGSITTGTLSANFIQGGTLNCNLMTVSNLNAGSITVGQFININDRLNAQAIHGDKITANSLNADRISAGTITADRIIAHVISTEQLAYRNVDGDYVLKDASVKNRAIFSDLSADKIVAGTLYVGGSGQISAINVARGSWGNAKIRFAGGSRIWEDDSNRIGINSIGSPMYLYVDSSEKIIIPSSGQTTMRGGAYMDGNLNVKNTLRVESGDIQVDGQFNTTTSDKFRMYINIDMGDNNIDAAYWVWAYDFKYRSDERLKKNVEDLDNVFENLLQLRPVKFNFKHEAKNDKKHFGFIAQELEKVFPELVDEDDEGMKGIAYGNMVPILVKAIVALKKEVDALKGGDNG